VAAVAVIALGVWVSLHLIQQKRPRIRPFASGDSQAYLQQEVAQDVPPAPVPPTPAPTIESSAAAETQPIAAKATLEAAAPAPAAPNPSPAPADQPDSVLHEELPEITRPIIDRIHGHVRVAVRVLVDPAGNVVGEFMESNGPSAYFSRLAGEAAGKWKFAPTDAHGARVWLLRFEFTRDGATAEATAS
jgi:outer membrane biosynthesis protein TonB